MEAHHVSLAIKLSLESPYVRSSNFISETSFNGSTTNRVFSTCSILVLFLVPAAYWYLARSVKLPFPVACIGPNVNTLEAIEEAKSKYPNQPFILPGEPSTVMLPNCLLDKVKNLPEDQISFRQATYELLLGRYTSIGANHPYVLETIKLDLTRHASKTLTDMQDLATFAIDTEFGACNDRTAMKVQERLVKAVSRISARIFVGLPLCRDEEWLSTTIRYTEDVMNACENIKKYPFFLRPLIAPFLPECRQLTFDRQRAGKMLAPTIAAIIKSQTIGSNDTYNKIFFKTLDSYGQYNMMSWILGHYKANEKPSPQLIGEEQLMVSMASIHTTRITTAQALFDLASYPEHVAELRTEINQAVSEEPDRKFEMNSMPKLRKFDSFIKESQRMHPLGMVVMPRLVTAKNGLTLSPSVHLPKETFTSFVHPQHRRGSTLSQSPLDEFHPLRYAGLRSIAGEENKHQFLTTSLDSLSFGHGLHACPGRFFASNLIKVLLAELINRYDIALSPKGDGACGQVKRPETFTVGTSFVPNPFADIYFRQR